MTHDGLIIPVDTTRTSPSTMTSAVSKNDDTDPARFGLWSLPPDVISTHILRSDFLPETADLGRLRAVCHGMRDAVDATGREIEKLSNWKAMGLGNVSLLKDRHSRGLLKGVERRLIFAAAAINGDLEELKALRAANFPWDWSTCEYAALYGRLALLKWLRENSYPWDESTCAHAAKGGHLEVLKWLRENGCPWDWRTCAHAAEGGHLEVLQWACENECPWDWRTCAWAAEGGHLEVLQWARANGCPWDEGTCARAAEGGHLEVLKWARENGCRWNEYTRGLAARKGYVESS